MLFYTVSKIKLFKENDTMGYTTKFKGELSITPCPAEDIIELVNKISHTRHDDRKYPGIWCQWIINIDKKLEWNGAEKFYNYIEWLEYLIKNIFAPRGYKLDGRIRFQGERFLDIGIIYVKDNSVRKIYGLDDVTDDEIIIALTMDEEGNTKMEILA